MRRFLKRYYLPRLRAKNVNKLPRRERAGAIVIHGFGNETIQTHCSACQILLSVRGTKSKIISRHESVRSRVKWIVKSPWFCTSVLRAWIFNIAVFPWNLPFEFSLNPPRILSQCYWFSIITTICSTIYKETGHRTIIRSTVLFAVPIGSSGLLET